mgnify:CR=1 FL=1|tara:strand:- start:5049 stop:5984 length:936 start_codon:yes stop_codon:yes gene_type:complete
MKALVIAEHHQGCIHADTLKVIGAAQTLTCDIDLVVFHAEEDTVSEQAQKLAGIAQVISITDPSLASLVAESLVASLVALAPDYSHIMVASTSFGKNLLPRVAAALDVGQVSDVIAIESPTVFVHPIYAGNAIEKVEVLDEKKVISIRASVFDSLSQEASLVEKVHVPFIATQVAAKVLQDRPTVSARPALSQAQVVVAGGRGLGDAKHFALIEELADTLGAAIGASRAAVDAGFVSNDLQVGQTGTIVAPELYFAIGISGAIQHVAGMKESKVIVAVNKDPDAPIFQIADYGLHADLFEALPELIAYLRS